MLRTFPLLRFAAALLLGVLSASPARAAPPLTLTHVHGLAYSADGTRIFIPSHHGLAVYSNGQWSKAPGPEHDYMGFAVTRQFFFSSGHPAPGSGLVNPFGLIKSGDGGASWRKLGLEGESDFHLLATSYGTNAVYVLNTHANSRMKQGGLHYTLNDGLLWQRAEGKGLAGEIAAIAVHPSNAKTVAVATDRGLFLSEDAGASFQPLAQGIQVLSAFFELDGRRLWFGSHDGKAALSRLDLNGHRVEKLPLPLPARDAVAYIAQNPAKPKEWAIATFNRDVYVSADEGRTWKAIAKAGATL